MVALFAGYVKQWQRWEFNAFARVDNLFDQQYIGSVIVNEGNARYYEPAPGRNWTVGMSGGVSFLKVSWPLRWREQRALSDGQPSARNARDPGGPGLAWRLHLAFFHKSVRRW